MYRDADCGMMKKITVQGLNRDEKDMICADSSPQETRGGEETSWT
ncbi:hypothetical protein [Lachnoclostridium sp. An138]|nr:hypothetical protein [Lachnoclostridium sp. An138]